jgi:hypothetical protein
MPPRLTRSGGSGRRICNPIRDLMGTPRELDIGGAHMIGLLITIILIIIVLRLLF